MNRVMRSTVALAVDRRRREGGLSGEWRRGGAMNRESGPVGDGAREEVLNGDPVASYQQ